MSEELRSGDERPDAPVSEELRSGDERPDAPVSEEAYEETERLARAGLSALIPPTRAVQLRVEAHGAELVWSHLRRTWAAEGRPVPDPARLLHVAATRGMRLVVPGDEEWPPSLADLAVLTAEAPGPDARRSGRDVGVPFALWLTGPLRLAEAVHRSAAVVGARAATPYGDWLAAELGAGLAERQTTVVSGAAYGVDGAAHRGALAADGRTVAVLAGGADVVYPGGHHALLSRIAAVGLIVAEAPPGTAPRREAFLRRNRLIAAMSRGVVLVEAGIRSGARNTVAHAAALGRPRMVVPGPVTSALSAGCHAVLRSDPEARLVTCAAEVVEEVGRLGADLAPVRSGPSAVRDGLGDDARALLDLLPARGCRSLDSLAVEMGLSAVGTVALLTALQTVGLVEQTVEGYQLTATGRAPSSRRAG